MRYQHDSVFLQRKVCIQSLNYEMSALGRRTWQIEWPYPKEFFTPKKIEQETNQILYYIALRKTCNYVSRTIHGIFNLHEWVIFIVYIYIYVGKYTWSHGWCGYVSIRGSLILTGAAKPDPKVMEDFEGTWLSRLWKGVGLKRFQPLIFRRVFTYIYIYTN